jgi:hypothetical protein
VEDNAYSLFYLTSTHKAGVQGDAVPLPEREVSSQNLFFFQFVPPQAAQIEN